MATAYREPRAYAIDPTYQDAGDCKPCEECCGTGRTDCPACAGTKLERCDECRRHLHDNPYRGCTDCLDTGLVECRVCDGDGYMPCPDCEGSGFRIPMDMREEI